MAKKKKVVKKRVTPAAALQAQIAALESAVGALSNQILRLTNAVDSARKELAKRRQPAPWWNPPEITPLTPWYGPGHDTQPVPMPTYPLPPSQPFKVTCGSPPQSAPLCARR